MLRWLPLPVGALVFGLIAVAVPPGAEKVKPEVAAEVQEAASRAKLEKGLTAKPWASEPDLVNPVAFAFDEKGACYVVETNRFSDGVPDTRGFMYWLDDDIGARSVEDRLAMYKKHKYPAYEKFGETIRKVWDSKNTGKADKSTLFAGPFNKPEDGVGAGVMARNGEVFFTCIPALYKLKDTQNTGIADKTEVLSTGYGIHVQFVGHDLHGLVMGPDGKVYFSIGDRGFKVVNKEGKTLNNPDSGAVLRCYPDGRNLEIVHIGLRNPQELAFDDLGNLFTYDNNSDSGDKARWVQIVEGGDSGWRCGYQYGTLMHTNAVPQGNRGPWNTEKIWHVPSAEGAPPAYVVPPLMHFGNGPSGLTYYPGVGLSERYQGHFFACDFTANPGNSVIWSLAVKPKGASFEVTDLHPFVKNMVATDCDFGPDGAFYWLDWVGGWSKPQKGRIFRVTDDEAMKNPAVAEAQKLLAEGFAKTSTEDLIKLFDHPHRKVRQEAQFELVKRPDCKAVLLASKPVSVLAKLHIIWSYSQLGIGGAAEGFLKDDSADVRRNAVQAVGRFEGLDGKSKLLNDPDLGVRAAAIRAYAQTATNPRSIKVHFPESQAADYAPIFKMLQDNDNKDVYLRQACVDALVKMVGEGSPCELANAWKANRKQFDHPAIRMGMVLALRRLQCNKLDEWLADSDPAIVAEAARAIYDQELATPMPGLARLAEYPGQPDAVAFRALAANFRLGEAVHAERLATVAANASQPEAIRITAMKLLEDWAKPKRLDPITGLTMNLGERSPKIAQDAVKKVLEKLFVGSDAVRKESAALTAKLGIAEVGPLMLELLKSDKNDSRLRVDALFALEAVKAKQLGDATKLALSSTEPRLRAAARVVNAKTNPTAAMRELPALITDPRATIIEKQMALGAMGALKESPEVDKALVDAMDAILAKLSPAELKLDIMEAAEARSAAKDMKLHGPIREKLKAIDTADRAAVAKDPLARDRAAIAGGDALKGKEIFLNSAAVYCQRCHKLDNQGGEVGPSINGIGTKQTRDYLLEAIVNPNAKIAEGYQSVILTLADGRSISGVLRAKDAKSVTIVTPENKTIVVPKDDIDAEKPDKSAMPDDLVKKLSKRELRDLVEFLAGLK
jgi:quinoprotein glucose dehydrogenase